MATLITKNSSTASAVPAAGDLVKGELAVNVTDKKVYTKDNSAAVVKLVGSLGNQEANAVAVTGGTINGTTIGATTPSTGAFTTASASSGFTGNLTGNVTGNVSGTAANVTGVVAIANGGTGLSALGTGVQSALGQAVTGSGSFVLSTSPSLTTPNLGTPSAAVLTNATGLPLTTGVTGTLGVANGGTGITAFGTGVATALGQNVTGSGGIVLATSPSLTTPNLGTPSAATLTNATGLPISTGVSGLGTGVATALAVNTGSAGAFVVNGGALGTPSSGTVTNLTGTASININGTVGATTPTTGAFTTLSASGNITVSGGTANGVAYLNGSKVLTTGSALTFDGTTLTVAGQSNGANNSMTGARLVVDTQFGIRQRGASAGISGNTYSAQVFSGPAGGDLEIYTASANSLVFGVNTTEAMRLTSTSLYTASGINVGIGTSNPSYRLSAQAASANTSVANFSGANPNRGLTIKTYQSNGGDDCGVEFNAANNAAGYGAFRFVAASTTFATIDYLGNLGLGTTNPSLASGMGIAVYNSTVGGAARIALKNGSTGDAAGDGFQLVASGVDAYIEQRENGFLAFTTNNTERARITSGGALLVGTTSEAGYLFRVAGGLSQFYSTAAADFPVHVWNSAASGDNGFVNFYTDAGATLRGSIDYNRAVGLTRYNTTSDYRAKDIIGPVQNTGATIDALKVYEGVMKGATQARPMMIAHEAQAVTPYAVTGEKDAVNEDGTPKYQQMDHASLVPLLISELQSLRARVAQLEAK